MNNLLSRLAYWHGWQTADLIYAANEASDLGYMDLWRADPDFALIVGDWLDVESLLDLGGCLDSTHA